MHHFTPARLKNQARRKKKKKEKKKGKVHHMIKVDLEEGYILFNVKIII